MYNNYTDNVDYESCSVIIHGTNGNGSILIGDFNSAIDSDTHKKHNIKAIITAAANMEHLHIPNNITHITYPLLDAKSENIRRYFDDCAKTISTCTTHFSCRFIAGKYSCSLCCWYFEGNFVKLR